MVSVDISLTPSLPGATLSLSLSLNKRILGDFTGYYVFSEEFASDRRKASRGSVNQNGAGTVDENGTEEQEATARQFFIFFCFRVEY